MATAQERLQKEIEVTIKHLSGIVGKATHPLVAISSAAELFVSVLKTIYSINPDAAHVIWQGVTAEVSKIMEEENTSAFPTEMIAVPQETM